MPIERDLVEKVARHAAEPLQMSGLTSAIMIACEAHDGQVDKAGEPYILHPLRVMQAMTDETHRIVAVLHDVAEDCDVGWDRIHDGDFSEKVRDAIDALTRREGEAYTDFILRCSANEIARRVKIADIRDNLRPGAEHLRKRYEDALAVLDPSDTQPYRQSRGERG